MTVTFVSNGGTECPDLILPVGGTPTLPTPTRAGYDFIGWYLDEAFLDYYTDTPITADLTLYALFAENKISGGSSDRRIYTDVGTDFTFTVFSYTALTDRNLSD